MTKYVHDSKEAIKFHRIKCKRHQVVSWNKKYDEMIKFIATELEPVQDRILDLRHQQQQLIDHLTSLRQELLRGCIHPPEQVVTKEGGVLHCKFCDKEFRVLMDGDCSDE